MIGDIPDGVLLRIFSCMDYMSILISKTLCKRWHAFVSKNNAFWKDKLELDFGEMDNHEGDMDFEWEYNMLHKLIVKEYKVVNLKRHEFPLSCLKCVGSMLVSAGYDNMVQVWDLKTMERMHVQIADYPGPCATILPPSTLLMENEGNIVVFDLDSRQLVREWKAHDGPTMDMQICDGHVVTGAAASQAKVWKLETGECLCTINVPRLICFHVHGGEIMCGMQSQCVHVFSNLGEMKYTLHIDHLPSYICANSHYIFVGEFEGGVEVWDRRTKERVVKIEGTACVIGLVVCGARLLACGTAEGEIGIWDMKTWTCKRTIDLGQDHPQIMHYSEGRMVVGFGTGELRVLDFNA